MRRFHLEPGPAAAALSEAEVAARLASGELTPDQPCRLEGEDTWRTLADFFPAGSGLKVRTAKPTAGAAEQISAAHRIDDLTRRRLLIYGLADAVNIDGFTQAQAMKGIGRKEAEIRAVWRAHRRAQAGAFVALLALGGYVGATTNPISLSIERSAALFQRQAGDVKANYAVLRSSLDDLAYVRERDRRNEAAKPKPAAK